MVPVIGNGNDNGLGLEFRRVGDPASSIQHPESSIRAGGWAGPHPLKPSQGSDTETETDTDTGCGTTHTQNQTITA